MNQNIVSLSQHAVCQLILDLLRVALMRAARFLPQTAMTRRAPVHLQFT